MTSRSDEFKRWTIAWRVLAALAFVVVAGSALSQPAGWPDAARFWVIFLAMAVWYWCSVFIGRDRLYNSLPLSLFYFSIGWVLWAELLRIHPATYAFAAFLFPLTYSHLPTRRAIAFALVLTGLMYVRGTAMVLHFSVESVLGGALGVISTVMLAVFIDSIIRKSEERQQLIHALEEARAELAQVERQAGVLAERQRLAQEIHDTVAQGFVGIVTHLEAAETSLNDAAAVARHLTAAKGAAREGLEEARRLVSGLRPDLLRGEPLSEVLARQLGQWSSRTGIAAGQVVTGTPRRLDADREEALVQAAREGLNNVRTHAKAARVTLTLSYMEDEVVLDLEDNGAGVRAAPNPEGGFGLRALTERVRALGGRCELESREDGATLSVALSIEA